MDARYDPAAAEGPIFARWEQTGVFAGGPAGGEPYAIALPPPNVTGELHMGHALNGSFQDALIRLRRMQGRDALWICGTDHASIAVHAVIEKQLRAEGKTRFDLGREAFLERVWKWREATGATIIQQFRRLGCTLDYGHERFTMDEGYVRAVLEMFVRLHAKGWIYRDNRLINWCPTCASTISDLEVRYEHAVDTLFEVRYRIKDTDDFLAVATVRPETILADTAVAVHPADERYTHLVGKTAIVPLVDREVPIIADEYVKMDFGTGALKITPGHDPNDFEIGRRHGLAELSAIGHDGRMSDLAGEFAGLPVGEARGRVRDALFAQGLLRREEPYEHEVGHCDRTGDRIEPLISLQWFMQMDQLAAAANAQVRSGNVRFHPKSQENTYFNWMDNIRPWCISRQLWWGHQIPVWYCPDGHHTAAVEEPATCATCGSSELRRDPDILDTWFSSALWPFATIGWPGDDPRLEKYYPGHVLTTARDIINLWVARMLMMGLEFMDDIPFSDVVINSTIQAPDGRRMSKSLGTGVDPLELVDTYGADATRYGLMKMSSTQDVRFSRGAIAEGAKFANKLWNAARFVVTQADLEAEPAPVGDEPADRWVRSRLARANQEVLRQLDAYDFSAAVKALYAFVFDYCDWYIEAAKPRLAGDDAAARRAVSANLLWTLERILALTHPICPFVTEAVWSHLPGERGLLMLEPYPAPVAEHRDPGAEGDVQAAIEAVSQARSTPEVRLLLPKGFAAAALVRALAPRATDVVEDSVASVVVEAKAEDPGVVRARLEQDIARARSERDRSRAMLANERFTAKAPPQKVEEERAKEARYTAELEELEARLRESV
ncbi:MAG TPA: valine--tRNA ligase [Gaiellales bacterium]|nr:valine--tRNA ligase [Gaiellales bacterium]